MAISLTTQPALWQQLQVTASVLMAVRQGVSGTAAIAKVPGELRPGVQALTFAVLRSLGRAQALRQLLASRNPPPAADALLCTALALSWRDQDAPYEVFTLVNQTVEAAKRDAATRPQAGFLNACLRRFLRERDTLVASTDAQAQARWNHPVWWIDRLRRDWPDDWQNMLVANNTQAPLTLRVNTRRTSVAAVMRSLETAGLEADATGATALTLRQAKPVQALPGFFEGLISVQDIAAQLAAPLLLNGLEQPGRNRVLDACAAPGGKTAHLLELADCDVIALDVDPVRCERVHETLQRLGLQARVVAADAAAVTTWWDGQPFDAILLDAPCSASGIVRRHPDVRWLRRPSDIDQLVAVQARLLNALWPLLRPGGRLLYSTCSVFRAEGENQIQTFLAHNTEALLLPSPGHLLPFSPPKPGVVLDNPAGEHDGFYYALLQKRPL
jgi:16S rRNA (cytosine967-C5)-methyltransferase